MHVYMWSVAAGFSMQLCSPAWIGVPQDDSQLSSVPCGLTTIIANDEILFIQAARKLAVTEVDLERAEARLEAAEA